MMKVTTYQGPVAVYGLGVSGMACVDALVAGGCQPIAWDDDMARRQEAQKRGAQIDPLETFPDGVQALVLSPGIALTHPKPHDVVLRARQAGIEIIGDMDLFAREMAAYRKLDHDFQVVAITGTNGKSTTTALTAHILSEAGFDVQMGGNIGQPVMALAPPNSTTRAKTIYVLELSSYQIDLAAYFAADIAVLLNITPDHLDRHGGWAGYCAAKEKLFTAQSDGAHISNQFFYKPQAIINLDDAACAAIAGRIMAQEKSHAIALHGFSAASQSEARFTAQDKNLFDGAQLIASLEMAESLKGAHNMQNALAASGVARLLDVAGEKIAEALQSFSGLAHRSQKIRAFQGVHFINDSKATNADATRHALRAYEKIFWIAGGLAKDTGLDALMADLDNVQKAYLIGAASQAFAQDLEPRLPCAISETLDKAVPHAASDAMAAGGGVVLFSPAAASFDQYDNFEQRGDAFCALVEDCLVKMQGEAAS